MLLVLWTPSMGNHAASAMDGTLEANEASG